MDIHVDIRRFLEIHIWICYGFPGQGLLARIILGQRISCNLIVCLGNRRRSAAWAIAGASRNTNGTAC